MPVVLLVLGVVTTLAGLVLVASGFAVRDGTFDTEVLTPGTIAIVGGLLLIGLGFVVRELRRIERALAARPMARLTRVDDAAAAEASDAATAMPPPIPKTEPQVASAAATAAEASVEDAALERLRAKLPTIPRVENGRVAEAADVSLALREGAGLDEGIAEMRSVATAGRATNGIAAPARIVPRIDARARQAASSGKAKVSVFNTFWPATPRREGQAAPAQAAASAHAAAPAPPTTAYEPVSLPEPAQPPPLLDVPAASGPVSVLKSGVVEGMAYTLYSDGSIEAQLPQGTLRFGSISALRNHIENTA
jgi:hypothetical protein